MKHLINLLAIVISFILNPVLGIFIFFLVLLAINNKKTFENLVNIYKQQEKTIDPDKEIFNYTKYQYMKSELWQRKRKTVLERDNYTCRACGISGVPLDVHHLKGYDKIPNESPNNLVSLCKECHELHHIIYGYPKTLKDYQNWNTQLIKKHTSKDLKKTYVNT